MGRPIKKGPIRRTTVPRSPSGQGKKKGPSRRGSLQSPQRLDPADLEPEVTGPGPGPREGGLSVH